MELNVIHCEDCLEGMKKMGEDSVEISITSPPYNIGSRPRGGKDIYIGYEDNLPYAEYQELIDSAVREMLRVTKRYVFFNIKPLTANKKNVWQLIGDWKDNVKDIIIWEKPCTISMTPNSLYHSYEMIIVLDKNNPEKCTYEGFNPPNDKKPHSVWYGGVSNVGRRRDLFEVGEHAAVFPLWLPRFIVSAWTIRGETVLDPFMGTGTTAYIAKMLGRKYVGFELQQKYIDLAEKRMKQESLTTLTVHSKDFDWNSVEDII